MSEIEMAPRWKQSFQALPSPPGLQVWVISKIFDGSKTTPEGTGPLPVLALGVVTCSLETDAEIERDGYTDGAGRHSTVVSYNPPPDAWGEIELHADGGAPTYFLVAWDVEIPWLKLGQTYSKGDVVCFSEAEAEEGAARLRIEAREMEAAR